MEQMQTSKSAVESVLNVGRMAKTVVAANGFSRSKQTPEKTEGQSQFNLRQAMSLDPRIGKIAFQSVNAPSRHPSLAAQPS